MRKTLIIANNFAWLIGVMILCIMLNNKESENRNLKIELMQCRKDNAKANSLIKKANDIMSSPSLLIVYW